MSVVWGQDVLVKNGATNYVVVVPQRSDSLELLAAHTLQRYVEEATGASLPVVLENDYKANEKAIFLGETRWTDAEIIRDNELLDDGFIVLTDRGNLYVYSLSPKGVLYGVYYFLEHYLGVRMFTPEAIVVPKTSQLLLPRIDVVENPSFAFRDELYYYPNISQEYADFHRLHNTKDLMRNWGMFVHTFQHLVPAKRYYDAHPEWFSETNGKRLRDGQLCLSNPEVLEVLCKNLDSMMRERPDAQIWSVSNNDNYNVCECEKCKQMDALYGGASGTLIHFINQVAERFPDKTISTLGYQFTRKAPQSQIRPRENVNIMFCSIECGREAPLATDENEAQFRKDMKEWSEKTQNIFMWDYVTQFRNMMSPFPNLHVLQPNLKFFKSHGVRLMFEQGCSGTPTSWMELRTYLIAKLMWDVDANVDSLITDFCNGYYGSASAQMQWLYKRMEERLIASGQRLDIYGYPSDAKDGYLSKEAIAEYKEKLSSAYQAVGDDAALIDRIRFWELSLDYAVLELGIDEQGVDAYKQLAERFVKDCERFGVTMMMEMGISPQEYLTQINEYLDKLPQTNLAYKSNVTLATLPNEKYFARGAKGLTDGVCGRLDYRENWLGFYGDTMDAVLDLGRKQNVNEVFVDFYFYPLSWIFEPQDMEVYVSSNGKHWEFVGHMCGTNAQELARPEIHRFSVGSIHRKARYVRVVAKPIKEIPEWHRAAGNPCWIFCDEVVVR